MVFFPSLAKKPVLMEVFKRFPRTTRPLLEYHEILLRGPSPLTKAQRELIAAYVSRLNGCRYCRSIHTETAEQLGVPKGLVQDLVDDLETAGVEEKMLPILRYVKKLTENPAGMTQADADAVYAAGWDEQALHDAVATCALFNFMNRYVEGLGVEATPDYVALSAKRLIEHGYLPLLDLLDKD